MLLSSLCIPSLLSVHNKRRYISLIIKVIVLFYLYIRMEENMKYGNLFFVIYVLHGILCSMTFSTCLSVSTFLPTFWNFFHMNHRD